MSTLTDIPQVASHLVQFCLTVPASKRFLLRIAAGDAQPHVFGRLGRCSGVNIKSLGCFSAVWTSLSSRFRSVWVRIAVTRIAVALVIGGWRQGRRAPSGR